MKKTITRAKYLEKILPYIGTRAAQRDIKKSCETKVEISKIFRK